jgi:hypothetical protein
VYGTEQEEAIKLLQDLYVRVVEDAEKCRGGGLEATEAVRILGNIWKLFKKYVRSANKHYKYKY